MKKFRHVPKYVITNTSDEIKKVLDKKEYDNLENLISQLFNAPFKSFRSDDCIEFINRIKQLLIKNYRKLPKIIYAINNHSHWHLIEDLCQENLYINPKWLMSQKLITSTDLYQMGCRYCCPEICEDAINYAVDNQEKIEISDVVINIARSCHEIFELSKTYFDMFNLGNTLIQEVLKILADRGSKNMMKYFIEKQYITVNQLLLETGLLGRYEGIKFAILAGATNINEVQDAIYNRSDESKKLYHDPKNIFDIRSSNSTYYSTLEELSQTNEQIKNKWNRPSVKPEYYESRYGDLFYDVDPKYMPFIGL